MTITQRFCNSSGQTYAHISGSILIKNEKEKDRLRILDKRGYALDVSLLNEAIEAGATELEIKEITLAGSQRIYKTSLIDIQKHSRRVTLAGVDRYAFSLAICKLVSGLPEEWQLIEHARLYSQNEAPRAREAEQASLFADTELIELAQAGRWG